MILYSLYHCAMLHFSSAIQGISQELNWVLKQLRSQLRDLFFDFETTSRIPRDERVAYYRVLQAWELGVRERDITVYLRLIYETCPLYAKKCYQCMLVGSIGLDCNL